MSHYLQYIAIRFVGFFLNIMPTSLSIWCGRRAGDIGFFFMARRRNIALDNIRKAFGSTLSETEIRGIGRAAFQNAAIALIEFFIVKKIKANVDECFTLLGNEHLEQAFAQGKGALLVISHLGAWEYLSFLPYLTGQSWTVIVKNLRNPYLNNYINRLRRVMTVQPVDKDSSMRPILRELKNNHGIAILIDQWAGNDGLWLDFFDVKTSTTSVPARLAKKTGCLLIPGYCLRKSLGKYEIHIHPAVPLDQENEHWEKATTEKLNRLFEEKIRKYPEQWLWGHRRWKNKPSQIRMS